MRQYIVAPMPPPPRATTIGAPILPAPIVLAHRYPLRQWPIDYNKFIYICSQPTEVLLVFWHIFHGTVYWRTKQKKFEKKRRTEHFSAPRLFSWLSPIN